MKKIEKTEIYVYKDKMNFVNRVMLEIESYDVVEIIRKVEGFYLLEYIERFEVIN